MDLIVSKSDLSHALSLMQAIVEKRTTMPILSNVLLSASEGMLGVSGTDLEITALTKVPAEVRTAGSTTVSARILADVVRELPDGKVHIRLGEAERIELVGGKAQVKIVGVSADEYPSLPGLGFEPKSKLKAGVLAEMLGKSLYAVSSDETRFNLNGVCFTVVKEGKSSSLQMVATDGHRLALITRPVSGFNISGDVIVPRKGLSELKKLLDENPEMEVGIEVSNGFLVIESGVTKVSMRLIDGEFPDYSEVLPKDKGASAKMRSSELSAALRRVALMVTDKNKCVRFDFSSDSLRLSSSSPELGEATEELAIEYKGEQISVGFNARYVYEVLTTLGEDQNVNLELHGVLGPGKITAEHDESYIAIVMPMRL